MDKKRFFRALVCFVLICSLIINNSYIKAKAVVAETAIGIGLVAMLIAGTAGVVFHPETAEQIVAIGENMTQKLRDWGQATGKSQEVEIWIAGLTLYDAPDPEDPRKTQVALARGILAGISAWCATLILGLDDAKVEEPLPDGWFYNDILLPALPDGYGDLYPVAAIWQSNGIYQLVMAQEIPYRTNSGNLYCIGPAMRYQYTSVSTDWEFVSGDTELISIGVPYDGKWANITIPFFNGSRNWIEGTEPVTSETIEIERVYVGDIPQKVEDGELEEDKIPLPEVIGIDKLLQSDKVSSAQEAVTQVMEQLASGQMSYNDYMDNVTVDAAGGDDPEGDEISGDDGPIQSYGLDLTDFFPFCIPFDIYDFFSILAADPVAPVFKWEISVPQLGQTFDVELDLSIWDSVAALFRKLELLGFILGLAYVTREKYLRG